MSLFKIVLILENTHIFTLYLGPRGKLQGLQKTKCSSALLLLYR